MGVTNTARDGDNAPRRPRPRPSPSPAAPSKRRNIAPLAAGVLILTAVGATVYALIALPTNRSDRSQAAQHSTAISSTTASTPSSSAPGRPVLDAAMLGWLRAAVPGDVTVYAPSAAATALRSAGFAKVAVLGAGSTGSTAAGDLLVFDSATAADPAVATDLRGAVPVARFGTGRAGVSVAVVVGDPAERRSALTEDRASRLSADTALAANAAVHAAPDLRNVLRRGGLDARPATLLALLAGSAPVTVAAMPVDPGETAAGRPARTIVLVSPESMVRSGLAQLPAQYRPASVTSRNGRTTLTWHLAVDPVRTVS